MKSEELGDALSANRIPWGKIADAGFNIVYIAHQARLHGDEILYQRAKRAAVRRGLWL